ncbi:hypothetical protein LTR36_007975 [Oleoguttula mirabilis]|uniref:Phosphotyrosine protein phosphatase I domain-containing protein n=1 Tax=Oleoguttula mirabilis TaxID=1507867 RepID=A0AAV9J9H2_9PEZI|nr:hypothetical protein LTR36_007975 [Oleoguttula mirabilis]
MAATGTTKVESQPSARPVSVLFVCLGNICRSPMAEGVFRDITHFGTAEQHPLIADIDSCGTGAYHAGDYSDTRTMSVLEDNGIADYTHKSRKVKVPEDFQRFDYLLAMDEENLVDLRDLAKRAGKRGLLDGKDAAKKVYLFGEFGTKGKDEEVGDPYYGPGRDGFVTAFEQVSRLGRALLNHIEQQSARDSRSTAP